MGNSQQMEPFSAQKCLQNRAQQQQCVYLKASPLQMHRTKQRRIFPLRASPEVLVALCGAIERGGCVFDRVCAETNVPQIS